MVSNNYSGGNATVLTGFLGGITNTIAREQQRLATQQAQEAKRLQTEQQELAETVKKVNTTGVQQNDIAELSEMQSKVYDTYYRASKAKTPQERLTLRVDLERELQEMSQFVNQSKQRGIEQVKLADFIGNPNNMGLISQDAITKFRQNSNIPTSKLPPNAFSREQYTSPDTNYLDKVIDSSAKSLLNNADSKRRIGASVTISGKQGTEQFSEQIVGKDVFATDLYSRYNNDIRFKNLVDFTSAQNGITKDEYILSVVDEYDKASKLKNTKQIETVFARAPRQSGSGSETVDTGTYRQQNVEGLLQKSEDTLGRVKAQLLPTAEVNYTKLAKDNKDYIRIKTPRDREKRTGGEVIFIALDDPNAPTKLNTYLSLATGEKVSGSKFGIQKGKPTGKLSEPIIRSKTNTKKTTKKGELD